MASRETAPLDEETQSRIMQEQAHMREASHTDATPHEQAPVYKQEPAYQRDAWGARNEWDEPTMVDQPLEEGGEEFRSAGFEKDEQSGSSGDSGNSKTDYHEGLAASEYSDSGSSEPTYIEPEYSESEYSKPEYSESGYADPDRDPGAAADSPDTDYRWGPPTGGEDYDEPAMPAVFVRDSEKDAPREEKEEKPYSYQLDGPSYDHTDEFEAQDISDNKVTAMAAYLLGPFGVIIALLAGQDSPYAKFHMRQSLKFVVVEALLVIISLLLFWTLIVPAAATIFAAILGVIKIITFISVCRGKAVEPAIIRSMGFLK